MAVSLYYVGQLVHLTAAFTVAGVATDPTSVTCTVKAPDGSISSPATTKDSTGNWHADVAATLSGRYHYGFKGTGTVQAAEESSFDVALSNLV